MKRCTITDMAIVTEPTALTVSAVAGAVSCNGGNDGSATLIVDGGISPYAYLWSNGGTDEKLQTIPAGTYSVTVYDANSCTQTTSVTITEPDPLTVLTSQTDVACNGDNTGQSIVTPGGGTSPYFYLWNNLAPQQTTQTATGLIAGIWTVTVTDNNGCTVTASVTITQPALLTVTTAQTDVTCNGGSDGTATVTATGGTGSYEYLWNTGNTTSSVNLIPSNSYTVTVSDANNCTVTASVTITQPSTLYVLTTQTNVSCFGGNNGAINITASGGADGYSYNWGGELPPKTVQGLRQGLIR